MFKHMSVRLPYIPFRASMASGVVCQIFLWVSELVWAWVSYELLHSCKNKQMVTYSIKKRSTYSSFLNCIGKAVIY